MIKPHPFTDQINVRAHRRKSLLRWSDMCANSPAIRKNAEHPGPGPDQGLIPRVDLADGPVGLCRQQDRSKRQQCRERAGKTARNQQQVQAERHRDTRKQGPKQERGFLCGAGEIGKAQFAVNEPRR